MNINLNQFTEIVRSRRLNCHFQSKAIPTELLNEILETIRWFPSAFKLHPTHFVVISDRSLKEKLYRACMNQRQVIEVGAVAVSTGGWHVIGHNLRRVLRKSNEVHAVCREYDNSNQTKTRLSLSDVVHQNGL